MTIEDDLIGAFELHAVEEIRAILDSGFDPRAPIRGKPPVHWLTEMYTRSTAFPACVRLLLDRGAVLDDPVVAPVLLDDATALESAIRADPSLIRRRTTMVSAFTSLIGVPLLHVAAEYGNLAAARVLLDMGAEVDARADLDAHGFNGHTALFHTVSSIENRSAPVMRLLLASGASVAARVAGLEWGKGFEWETTFFDVTPVSYAQLGLMPQVHRREGDVYANLTELLRAAGRSPPPLTNIPNRYLRPKREP